MKTVIIAAAVVVTGLFTALLVARNSFDATITGHTEKLGAEEPELQSREELPEPVRGYFDNVLPRDKNIEQAEIEHEGEFYLDGKWHDFESRQHVSVSPPGFVWDARIKMLPFLPVRVVDLYVQGEGLLHAKLLSAVTVAHEKGPELDEGELMRYLAESVWTPTILLSEDITWEPVNESAARATIKDSGNTASLVFHFRDDKVVKVTGERPREVDGRYEKTGWTGYFSDYQERDGVLLPIQGEVEWNLEDRDQTYWRGEITRAEYR